MKKDMKILLYKNVKIVFIFIVSIFIALIVLSLFCLFYSYDGPTVINTTGSTVQKRLPYQFTSYLIEGASFKKADENGFYNLYDIESQSPKVLIMGSSHMEAKQIQTYHSAASILNDYYSTYNIGVSGHDIDTCILSMENAIQEFHPTEYVCIETTDANIDVTKLNNIINNKKKSQTAFSPFIYFLSKYLPATGNIYGSLHSWMLHSNLNAVKTQSSMQNINLSLYDLWNESINIAADIVEKNGLKLVIFRIHPIAIGFDGSVLPEEENEAEAVKILNAVCKNNGVIFVDTRDAFIEQYENEHVLPHGFFNTIYGTGHLNKYGHKALAYKLAEAIAIDQVNNSEENGVI